MAAESWIHQIHRKNLGFLAIASAWPYAASKSESGFNPNFPRVLLARFKRLRLRMESSGSDKGMNLALNYEIRKVSLCKH